MSTLMVMAGGTGGHVYPAMAVADVLVDRGWNIVWLATEGGMENRLIAGKPYRVATIHMQGVRGKGLLRWLLLPLRLLRACFEAGRAMRVHRPDVVLGMGGFAAFPGGVMARLMCRPLIIHEQNSVAGLTNRVLSILATRVLAAFPSAFGTKAELTGNPVRTEITAIAPPDERFFGRSGPLRLLVVGGSLGAEVLNVIVPQALALMPVGSRPRVIHQAGSQHITALRERYQRIGVEAEARAFIEDIADKYAWCDLVICRAGALTIAEIAAAGVASILVPFPHAVDDHQTQNARYLADKGAAWLVLQPELTPQRLCAMLSGLTRSTLQEMAEKARALGKPEATLTVARICMEVA
ncbi:MAG: undecaprenyldiphospho-muramoylpentapeptide beta-N-acetylglucosaminyltransferase [Methylophilaceae bacterium]|nr:undecaprenyldiphospho-muramoylpentapeptide beta-N-acetylglucosaminyltransferase [Methylophilaceae bacterium]